MQEWDICSDRQYGGRSKGKFMVHRNTGLDDPLLTFEGVLKSHKHIDAEEAEWAGTRIIFVL